MGITGIYLKLWKAVNPSMGSNHLKHIAISPENYSKLRELGNMGSTFDSVITDLIHRAAVAAAPTKRDSEK